MSRPALTQGALNLNALNLSTLLACTLWLGALTGCTEPHSTRAADRAPMTALAGAVAARPPALPATQRPQTEVEGDVIKGLRPAPGRDQVLANCTSCHSTKLILQNRMSRERWDERITWMQRTQKLWPLKPEVRSQILDYLEVTQGVETDAHAETPWAHPLYRPNPLW